MKTDQLVFLVLALLVILSRDVVSKTWHIRADGTGDAPTIQAGVDSAAAGDTVLVAAGTFELATAIEMNDGIILTSESGPLSTIIRPEPFMQPVAAISCVDLPSPMTEVSGFWIRSFGFHPAGALSLRSTAATIKGNLFTGNQVAINISFQGGATIDNNTTFGNGFGIQGEGNGVFFNNNIIWDQATGLTGSGLCNDFLDIDDGFAVFLSFSLDPQFCGAGAGNLFLQSDSPCLSGNSPWGASCPELIGALPNGCGAVPVEERTWGAIKALYR